MGEGEEGHSRVSSDLHTCYPIWARKKGTGRQTGRGEAQGGNTTYTCTICGNKIPEKRKFLKPETAR